jgi:hypothetical protein
VPANDGHQFVRCEVERFETVVTFGRNTKIVEWSDRADMKTLVDRENRPGAPGALRGVVDFEFSDLITEECLIKSAQT